MPVGTTPKNRRTVPKPSAGALRGDFPTTTGPQTQIHTRTGPAPQAGPSGPLLGPWPAPGCGLPSPPDRRNKPETERCSATTYGDASRKSGPRGSQSSTGPRSRPGLGLVTRAGVVVLAPDGPARRTSEPVGPLQTGAPAEPNPGHCPKFLRTGHLRGCRGRELRQRLQGTNRVPNTPRGIPGGASDEREGSGSWTEISDPDQQPGDQNLGVLEPSGVGTEPNRLTWE
jgi:hypothetical protein